MGNQIHAGTMIYGITREQASEHMNELVRGSGETIVHQSPDTIITNKNRYKACFLSEGCRGYRYLEMYISKEILLDERFEPLFWEVALPKLVSPSYYDMSKWNEPYNWMEHVYIY